MMSAAWLIRVDAQQASEQDVLTRIAAHAPGSGDGNPWLVARDDLGALLIFGTATGSASAIASLSESGAPSFGLESVFGSGSAAEPAEIIALNERTPDAPLLYALYVLLEARPGKEADVARFLAEAQPVIASEPYTMTWYGLRRGHSHFAVIDFFTTAANRDGHRAGKVAGGALVREADTLLVRRPEIRQCDVLACHR